MTSKTALPHSFSPSEIARFQRSLYDRSRRLRRARLLIIRRLARNCVTGLVAGFRLLRNAPPLGDVGTRGNELTAWAEDWNRGGNPRDSNRE